MPDALRRRTVEHRARARHDAGARPGARASRAAAGALVRCRYGGRPAAVVRSGQRVGRAATHRRTRADAGRTPGRGRGAMSAARLDETARGVFPISATPFAPDGALDLDSLDRLVDFYLARRVHGLTLLGIMGEAPKLAPAESRAVVRRAVARVAGRVPVVVGVSNPNLAALAALANDSMAAGAAGVMVAPTSGIVGDDALVAYMASIVGAIDPGTPVVYQDYPQATGVTLTVEAFHRMVDDFPQLVMLKHEDAPGLTKL